LNIFLKFLIDKAGLPTFFAAVFPNDCFWLEKWKGTGPINLSSIRNLSY